MKITVFITCLLVVALIICIYFYQQDQKIDCYKYPYICKYESQFNAYQ